MTSGNPTTWNLKKGGIGLSFRDLRSSFLDTSATTPTYLTALSFATTARAKPSEATSVDCKCKAFKSHWLTCLRILNGRSGRFVAVGSGDRFKRSYGSVDRAGNINASRIPGANVELSSDPRPLGNLCS